MEKRTTKLVIALAILAAAIAAAMAFLVSRQKTELAEAEEAAARAADPYIRDDGVYDLREADLNDARLFEITGAVSVDLSGRDIDTGVYEAVRKNNPGAAILWDVPFDGKRLPNMTEAVTLTKADEETLTALGYFENLKKVDGTACAAYGQLSAYADAHPEIEVLYTVPLFGSGIASTEGWLSLGNLAEGLFDADELLEKLPYLKNVTDVDLVGTAVPDETKLKLKTARPDIRWYWFVNVGGRQFESTADRLDFTDVDFDSFDGFLAAMRLFNGPSFVDVATQGFESVQMARAVEEFPGTVFAWTLRIGKYYVRTDVTVLDMGFEAGDRSLKDGSIDELKYCTQLEALSLDNQAISDLTPLAGLTNLKILCLGSNRISDITPLAGLTELEYLNLSSNSISDISVLAGMTKLTDLNLMDNKISDLTAVTGLKNLKRLFVGKNDSLMPGEIDRAKAALGESVELNDSSKGVWKNADVCDVVDDIFTAHVMRELYEEEQ